MDDKYRRSQFTPAQQKKFKTNVLLNQEHQKKFTQAMEHDDDFFAKLVGDVKTEKHYLTYNQDLSKLLKNPEIKKMVKVAIVKKVGEPVRLGTSSVKKKQQKVTEDDVELEGILMDE